MTKPYAFTVGGTVQAGRGRYIRRQVDAELLDLCRTGQFAFVLSARQMGKSSLMVHTAQQLADEGTRTLIIDLSQIGVQVTQEEWYLSLLTTAEDKLALETDTFDWWNEHSHLSYPLRLVNFFKEVLLRESSSPLVVFVDEIDSTLGLGFTDDFFAAIRYVYNARSSDPEFNRLSFVLIGVATPNDLIDDPRRTPFNIGTEVEMGFFSNEEAMGLSSGFPYPPELSKRVLTWILDWTAGHPYLTQRLCALVADRHPDQVTRTDVDDVVSDTFLNERVELDANLRFVRDMLTRWAPDLTAVLHTYNHLLRGRLVEDDKKSPIIAHLKLAGVAGTHNGRLQLSTSIYASVFDRSWLKKQWPEHWIKRVPPMAKGLVAALFLITILTALMVVQTQKARQAVERNQIQAELNERLRVQFEVADSLRLNTDEANRRLSRSNQLLSNQIDISDSLMASMETVNSRLENQVVVSDSLRRTTESANDRLTGQVSISDSLRLVAEQRLGEARRARLETVTIALASKAERRLRLGDAKLGALLARQAYLFSRMGDSDFIDPVYHALVSSLNAVKDAPDETETEPVRLTGFPGTIRAVAFDENGNLAVGNEDGSITLLDGRFRNSREWRAHNGPVRFLHFDEGGKTISSGGIDGLLKAWNLSKESDPTPTTFGEHPGGAWTSAFQSTASRLATTGADDLVQVWDLSSQPPQLITALSVTSTVRSLAFSSDGELLYMGTDNGQIIRSDLRSNLPPRVIATGLGRINAMASAASGDRFAAGGDDAVVHIWRADGNGLAPEAELIGHQGPIYSLLFLGDDSTLVSGSTDQSIQIWRTTRPDSSPILLQKHTDWVWTLAFDPDRSRLASAGADRQVFVWTTDPKELTSQICDAMNGRELEPLEWQRHVGADFPFSVYKRCGRGDGISDSSGRLK